MVRFISQCLSVAMTMNLLKQVNMLRASLYTAKACRQCSRFKKTYNNLVEKYPEIIFETISLEGDNLQIGKKKNIVRIPTIIFNNDYEEETRIVATPNNIQKIEEICYTHVYNTKSTQASHGKPTWIIDKLDNLGITETSDKPGLIPEHLLVARMCENVYKDDLLRSEKYHIENRETDTQCTMSVVGEKLIVCFRGSDSTIDWKMNFYSTLSEFPFNSGRGVHAGFLVQWMSIENEFKEKLDKIISENEKNVKEIILTGHSSGGGIVCIIAASLDTKLPLKVTTFGSPRMCEKHFKEYVESKALCTRIVLDRDIITRIPFQIFGYQHIGNTLQIRKNVLLRRETNFLEAMRWMILGIPKADVGIRDHLMENYSAAIEEYLLDTVKVIPPNMIK